MSACKTGGWRREVAFPPSVRDANTFADLVQGLAREHPHFLAEAVRHRQEYGEGLDVRLMDVAREVAREFAQRVDLWEVMGKALHDSARHFKTAKRRTSRPPASFPAYFRGNLLKRFRRTRTRAAARAAVEVKAATDQLLAEDAGGGYPTIYKWAARILDQAEPYLGPQAWGYLRLLGQGKPVADIATALGVAVQTLRNKYSREKFEEMARQASRQVVAALSEAQRQLLARHLLGCARLSADDVRSLLGEVPAVGPDVPLLGVDEVMDALGWKDREEF